MILILEFFPIFFNPTHFRCGGWDSAYECPKDSSENNQDSAYECPKDSRENNQNVNDHGSENSFEVLQVVDEADDCLKNVSDHGSENSFEVLQVVDEADDCLKSTYSESDCSSVTCDSEDKNSCGTENSFSEEGMIWKDGILFILSDEDNNQDVENLRKSCYKDHNIEELHETSKDNKVFGKCSNVFMNNHASRKFQVKNVAHRKKSKRLNHTFILYKPFYLFPFFRILKHFALFFFGFAIVNKAFLLWEFRSLQLKGERVHVGHGQNMFINCVGKGKPTVILDAPTGISSIIWSTTLPQVSNFTKVCVYDRTGLGFSDPPPRYDDNLNMLMWLLGANSSTEFDRKVGTVSQMVEDLKNLISVAKPLSKPYILVGSGVSSLAARYFAQKYPGDVTSIVLVDPINETLYEKNLFSSFWRVVLGPFLQNFYLPFTCVVSRMAHFLGLWKSELQSPSEESMVIEKYQMHQPCHLISVQNEFSKMDKSVSQMRELSESNSFPRNISVAILNTHGIEMCTKDGKNVPQGSNVFPEGNFNAHPGCKQLQNKEENLKEFFRKPDVLVDHIHKLVNEWRTCHDGYACKILKTYKKMQNTVASYMPFSKT